MSSRIVQRATARQLQNLLRSTRPNGLASFSSLTPRHSAVVWRPGRFFSDKAGDNTEESKDANQEASEEAAQVEEQVEEEVEEAAEEEELSREEQLELEVSKLKQQLLRSLAEQENTRQRAKKDVESVKNFAVTSFAKSILETVDNLTRALDSVPEAELKTNPALETLYEGIQLTETGLNKALEKNGLTKFGGVGDEFDPHKHNALFEYVDPEQKAGTIGQVIKTGFVLNERVIRPAEVGVIKKE